MEGGSKHFSKISFKVVRSVGFHVALHSIAITSIAYIASTLLTSGSCKAHHARCTEHTAQAPCCLHALHYDLQDARLSYSIGLLAHNGSIAAVISNQ